MSNQLGSVGNTFRVGFGLTGLISLVIGIAIMVSPLDAARVLTAFIAVYAVIVGVVYIGIGIFAGERGGWARIGTFLAGLVFVVAGIVAFGNLGAATVGLAIVVSVFIGVAWIVEGIAALTSIGSANSKVWTIVYTIISVVAGATLIILPLTGAMTLWILVGIMLAIMGVVQIIRAFTFKGIGS